MKTAIRPSPVCLTTRPRLVSTAIRIVRMQRSTSLKADDGPRADRAECCRPGRKQYSAFTGFVGSDIWLWRLLRREPEPEPEPEIQNQKPEPEPVTQLSLIIYQCMNDSKSNSQCMNDSKTISYCMNEPKSNSQCIQHIRLHG